MIISVFDLFSVGIGPSSSHTVGPMKAANEFIKQLERNHQLKNVFRIKIELFGSLAFTGKGHGTDNAILLGLEGHTPDLVDPDLIKPRAEQIIEGKSIQLDRKQTIPFNFLSDYSMSF